MNDIETTERAIATLESNQQIITKSNSDWTTSTGYPKLNDLLKGGIPAIYSVALISPACDSKDLSVKNFLEKGLEDNEITFYITTETELSTKLMKKTPNLWFFLCNHVAKKTSQTLPNKFFFSGISNLIEISIAFTQAIKNIKDPQILK